MVGWKKYPFYKFKKTNIKQINNTVLLMEIAQKIMIFEKKCLFKQITSSFSQQTYKLIAYS